jgi:hypothetical protein
MPGNAAAACKQSFWYATKTDVLSPSDTAYPLLKSNPTERELQELFTPNLFELGLPDRTQGSPFHDSDFSCSSNRSKNWVILSALQRFRLPSSGTSRRHSDGTRYRTAYRPMMPVRHAFAT